MLRCIIRGPLYKSCAHAHLEGRDEEAVAVA